MAKFGLGKGLADLEAAAGHSPEIAALAGMPERVVVRYIPIDQIEANPDQPRKTFSADELDELARSIREHGVLQPIIIRSVSGKPHPYEIVAGERRWRASRIAGKDSIPALVRSIAPENAMEIALIENVQRENLNAIEECEAYKNIMDKCDYSLKDLGNLIGKSESYIRNILRLRTLPDGVKEMVKSGKISASHARTLAVAENAEELARRIVDEDLSVADAAGLVRSAPRSGSARRGARKHAAYPWEALQSHERAIEDALKIKMKISVQSKGRGYMTLYFDTIGQMELLVELLKQAGSGRAAS